MPETALINNWLFAAMTEADQDAFRPHLVRRELAQGETVLRAGDKVGAIHFPVSCQIANVMTLDTGQTLAVSTVGRGSVTGLAAFMADEPLGWDAVAYVPGIVWSMPAEIFRSQADESADLGKLLHEATYHAQLEAHARSICAAYHPVIPRLALWFLKLQEQTGGSSFPLTQEAFARLLGVQRTTIVTAFAALTASGGVTAKRRGIVIIKDRRALQAVACSCQTAAADSLTFRRAANGRGLSGKEVKHEQH